MTLNKLLILFVVLGLTSTTFAQSGKQEAADKLLENFQYVDAAEAYKELLNKGYNVEENTRKLADTYNAMRDPENAVKYYEIVVEQEGISPEYYFRYAQNLRGVRRYDESVEWLKKYRDAVQSSTVADKILTTDSIPKYKGLDVKNLKLTGFNSKFSDFGAYEKSGLTYFTSSRLDNRETSNDIYGWNEEPFLDIYTTYKSRDNADFLLKDKISPVKGDVNSKLHDGPISITGDGKTMYFTRNNIINNKEGKKDDENTNNLKIYRASKRNGEWLDVIELPFNSDFYSCRAPSISADGSTLYFSSDMPGTLGGTDIFKVKVDGDTFSEPINLGDIVNTDRDESFPLIYNDGRLFFSSNGHKGYGLFDVFVAVMEDEASDYNDVINLGPPVNTNLDDFSFFLNENSTKGFVSSNREGGVGSDDVYEFIIPQEEPQCVVVLEGQVTDAVNGKPIPNASVTIVDQDGNQVDALIADTEGNYKTSNVDCDKRYVIEAKSIKYSTQNTSVVTNVDGLDNVVRKDIELNPIEDVEFLANLEIIYFDFDKYNIRPDAAAELDKLANLMLNIYPGMVIKIGSHTDKRGSLAYNERLAINRANSTYEYLVSKGVSPERILAYKGYGENQPAIRCPNNDCNEVEHQLNRRSVFEIVRMK